MHRLWLAILFVALVAPGAGATTVGDLTRIKGQGEIVLRGLGLVTGLKGTGDSQKEMATVRPLISLLTNEGNAPAGADDRPATKSVAVVLVTAVAHAGAVRDDQLDVTVTTLGSCKSLEGGQLFLTPLRGPTQKNSGTIFAIAEGPIEIEDATSPTRARVTRAARMIEDIPPPAIEAQFDLVINEAFAGFQAASHLAESINAAVQPQGPAIARVVDARIVRVSIPDHERADKAGFLAAVQGADVNPGFLGIGAKVVYNAARGIIVVSSDVQISPVAITQKDLTITTATAAPGAERWTGVQTQAQGSPNARLTDLITALRQLNVPVSEQIAVIRTLHRCGALHAELIEDLR